VPLDPLTFAAFERCLAHRARLGTANPLLTDTLDGDGAAIDDGDVGDERPNDRRVLVGRGRLAMEGGRAGSVRLVRRAFVTASLSLLIARHGGGGGSREGVVPRAWSGERCDPLARSCWGSGAG
jgi:hypothetical protein